MMTGENPSRQMGKNAQCATLSRTNPALQRRVRLPQTQLQKLLLSYGERQRCSDVTGVRQYVSKLFLNKKPVNLVTSVSFPYFRNTLF